MPFITSSKTSFLNVRVSDPIDSDPFLAIRNALLPSDVTMMPETCQQQRMEGCNSNCGSNNCSLLKMRIEHLEAIDSVYESDEDDAGWDVVSDGDGSNINPNDDDNDYSNNMNNNGDDGDNYYDHYQPEMMETSASLCHDSMKSNGFTVSERLQKLNRDNNYTMEEDDADEQSMAIMDMLAQRMAALRLGFV